MEKSNSVSISQRRYVEETKEGGLLVHHSYPQAPVIYLRRPKIVMIRNVGVVVVQPISDYRSFEIRSDDNHEATDEQEEDERREFGIIINV